MPTAPFRSTAQTPSLPQCRAPPLERLGYCRRWHGNAVTAVVTSPPTASACVISTAAESQPTVRHAPAARRSHRPRAGSRHKLATSRSSAAEQQASGSMLRPPMAAALLTRSRAPALQPEQGLCDRCPSATPAHSWRSPQGRRASTTSSLSLSWAPLRLCTLIRPRQLASFWVLYLRCIRDAVLLIIIHAHAH